MQQDVVHLLCITTTNQIIPRMQCPTLSTKHNGFRRSGSSETLNRVIQKPTCQRKPSICADQLRHLCLCLTMGQIMGCQAPHTRARFAVETVCIALCCKSCLDATQLAKAALHAFPYCCDRYRYTYDCGALSTSTEHSIDDCEHRRLNGASGTQLVQVQLPCRHMYMSTYASS